MYNHITLIICENIYIIELNLQKKEVHYKYAMALEDDGKFTEAEEEFIKAEKSKEAIFMHIHGKNWIDALRVAETHDPASVADVLQAQAAQCFNDKEFSEFESLLLRAQVPELIVQKYKSTGDYSEISNILRIH